MIQIFYRQIGYSEYRSLYVPEKLPLISYIVIKIVISWHKSVDDKLLCFCLVNIVYEGTKELVQLIEETLKKKYFNFPLP